MATAEDLVSDSWSRKLIRELAVTLVAGVLLFYVTNHYQAKQRDLEARRSLAQKISDIVLAADLVSRNIATGQVDLANRDSYDPRSDTNTAVESAIMAGYGSWLAQSSNVAVQIRALYDNQHSLSGQWQEFSDANTSLFRLAGYEKGGTRESDTNTLRQYLTKNTCLEANKDKQKFWDDGISDGNRDKASDGFSAFYALVSSSMITCTQPVTDAVLNSKSTLAWP
jgi:hypothetical protein